MAYFPHTHTHTHISKSNNRSLFPKSLICLPGTGLPEAFNLSAMLKDAGPSPPPRISSSVPTSASRVLQATNPGGH